MLQRLFQRTTRREIGRRIPSRLTSTAPPVPKGFDPYHYTSGRWLKFHDQQMRSRHVPFDFDKLCERAISCSPGARAVAQCTKIEGGFNRAFLLLLDNGQSLVARIPFSVAGPARLITNSEIATINFLREKTSVPIPAILDWSDDAANPVGAEFIIMEHAKGVQLHGRWPSMDAHQHMLAVKALGTMVRQLASLEFPAYGSIYTANVALPASSLVPLSDGFCIGPHCGTRYWPCIPGDDRCYERKPPNRGPWHNHADYVRSLLDLGLSRIPVSATTTSLDFHGTVDEHLHLHHAVEQILLRLIPTDFVDGVRRPTLLHPDLHKRNIFVSDKDPSQITSVIDWQATAIEPAHIYADEIPDLCEYPEGFQMQEITDPPTKDQERILKDVTTCQQTWGVVLKYWLRDVHKTQSMDQDVARVLRYAPSAWRHGAVAIRDDLIQLAKRWDVPLGLGGGCPYQPTTEELAVQETLMPKFKENHELRQMLFQALGTDERGWVPIDRWEDVQWLHKELYDEWYPGALSIDGLSVEQTRLAWPFDLPGRH